ncbi:hypothetical protein HAX54_002815, partial [Datura stramonium]|nr:hypothetical protein [Datura stramonium]MCE3215561.1 hypothetical protein [Datura stramonium]
MVVSTYGDSGLWRGNNQFMFAVKYLLTASLMATKQKLTYSFSGCANLKLRPGGSSNANGEV